MLVLMIVVNAKKYNHSVYALPHPQNKENRRKNVCIDT